MSQKNISIKKRTLWMSFLVSLIVFVFMFSAAYKIAYHETEEILDQQLKNTAEWIGKQKSIISSSSDFSLAKNYNEEDIFVDIHLDAELLDSNLTAIVYFKQKQAGYYYYQQDHVEFIAYIIPLNDRQIQVAQPLYVRKVLAFELASTMLIPYLVFLPIVFLLLYFGIIRAMRPLNDLQDEFSQREYHDLSRLKENHYPVELKSIVDEVNALFSRIEKAQIEQNDFVSHAAHELRSPLTALNLQVKVLQKENPHLKMIPMLIQSIKRLQHMVQQMLDLARQGETQIVAAEKLIVQQLLTEVVQDLYPLAEEKHIDIALSAPDVALRLNVDRNSLYLILRNIIDNAIKYSPVFGKVEITVQEQLAQLEISIEDSGIGVDEKEYNNIMQKFYRINNVDIGSGLGLAIVQKSLLRLNAEIEFKQSIQLKGLHVIIRLPFNPIN